MEAMQLAAYFSARLGVALARGPGNADMEAVSLWDCPEECNVKWPSVRSVSTLATTLLDAACAAADAADRVGVVRRLIALHQLTALEAAAAAAAAIIAAAAAGLTAATDDGSVLVIDSVQESDDASHGGPELVTGVGSFGSSGEGASAEAAGTNGALVEAVLRATVAPVDARLAADFCGRVGSGGDGTASAALGAAAAAAASPLSRAALRGAVDAVRLSGLPVEVAERLRARGALGIVLPQEQPPVLTSRPRPQLEERWVNSQSAREVALSSALTACASCQFRGAPPPQYCLLLPSVTQSTLRCQRADADPPRVSTGSVQPSKDADCVFAVELEHRVTAHLVWPWLVLATAAAAADIAVVAPSPHSRFSAKYSPTLDAMLREVSGARNKGAACPAPRQKGGGGERSGKTAGAAQGSRALIARACFRLSKKSSSSSAEL
jgi:hypothetical protein